MKKQNMILTSVLALVIASPAMAAVGALVTDGAQCTIGDLGVSSGTANATAQFRENTYNCAAGTYLPAGSGWSDDDDYTPYSNGDDPIQCMQCPKNSYCPGSGNAQFTYSADSNQGITACSEEYSFSDVNSSSADSCYRECTTSDVEHSAAVTGRYYAGGATQNQCVPASTNGCETGYHYVAAAAPTLPSASTGPDSREYHSHDDENLRPANTTLGSGEWSVTWTDTGIMKGIASCNDTEGEDFGSLRSGDTFNSNSTGQYCWCKPTSWTPSGGAEQSLSAAWVFSDDGGDASYCAYDCANFCANDVGHDAGFRSALFGGVGATPAHCSANNITLSWNDEDGTQFESGSCTYDESLTVPSTHPDKRGYTFTGWQFVNSSQN